MAREPVIRPTTALARVRPAEAAIEVSATFSFMSCMADEVAAPRAGVNAARFGRPAGIPHAISFPKGQYQTRPCPGRLGRELPFNDCSGVRMNKPTLILLGLLLA